MYGYGFHIGRVFQKRIFKVISMYGTILLLAICFQGFHFSGFLECMGMIGVLAMCLQKRSSGYLESMSMIVILAMCFQKRL